MIYRKATCRAVPPVTPIAPAAPTAPVAPAAPADKHYSWLCLFVCFSYILYDVF